jgi:ketosteroid isomerase-like protein
MAMRLFAAFMVPVLVASLMADQVLAQELDQQTRQQIEAAHMKWVDAINTGDLDAFSSLYTPITIGVDAFGKQIGVNVELLQALHKNGITLSMPVEGVQALNGGQAAIAYGPFTSKYADPSVPPGQGNWVQVFEREGDAWKIRLVASSRSALAVKAK